jgi:hypothetical protein
MNYYDINGKPLKKYTCVICGNDTVNERCICYMCRRHKNQPHNVIFYRERKRLEDGFAMLNGYQDYDDYCDDEY